VNALELALAKQRLVLAAAAQRDELSRHAAGLRPLFHAADQVQAGVRWVRRNPELAAGGAALLVAVQPRARRFLWRWTRRGFFAWRLWRESDRWLAARPAFPFRHG
jgi:YqjK-like protein